MIDFKNMSSVLKVAKEVSSFGKQNTAQSHVTPETSDRRPEDDVLSKTVDPGQLSAKLRQFSARFRPSLADFAALIKPTFPSCVCHSTLSALLQRL